MSSAITLGSFVDLASVYHSTQFIDKSPFAYLGKPLTAWLDAWLTELGVSDQPVIKGRVSEHAILEGRVYVAEGAEVGPTAYVVGPTYIGPGAEVRHGAFIRGSAYIGPKAVVGHTTEVKGSIFFDGAKAGHFAYVGDAILGREVNLGAGTKLANLKLRGDEVKVKHPATGEMVATGLRKLGAILGDEAQTGCNAVLSPGTLLYPKTAVLPCVHFLGTLTRGIAR